MIDRAKAPERHCKASILVGLLGMALLLFCPLEADLAADGPAPVRILTSALPHAVAGLPYEEGLLLCSGGVAPYTWRISSGELPAWASGPLGEGQAVFLSGTPGFEDVGTSTFTIEVTDSLGQSDARELTLTVSTEVPTDYWTYADLPDLTEEERSAFAEKTQEEWEAYYLEANREARIFSDALEAYILEWYYNGADPRIPYELLPPSINNAKTLNWTLIRPEEIDPEEQWFVFPSFSVPENYAAIPAHSSDPHVTYLKMVYLAPLDSQLLIEGEFPYCRFMDYQILQPFDPEYPASGTVGGPEVPIVDVDIEPDPGHVNPFRTGADRLVPDRRYHLTLDLKAGKSSELNPELMVSPYYRAPGNTRVGGPFGASGAYGWGAITPGVLWVRYYAADNPSDPLAGAALPRAVLRLKTGETFWLKPDSALAKRRETATWTVPATMPLDPLDYLGPTLGWLKVYDLLLVRAEIHGYSESPPWAEGSSLEEKKQDARNSVAALFKRGPWLGSPGDLEAAATLCHYNSYLSRPFVLEPGKVLVITGKLPTTPDTRGGADFMPAAEARYWSISRYLPWTSITSGFQEQMGEGLCLSSLMDDEVVLDGQRRYIIVYSKPEDRPANALAENGVTWQPLGPTNFGSLTIRWMSVWPDHFLEAHSPHSQNIPWATGAWSQNTYDSSLVGTNQPGVMGPYHPIIHSMTRQEFEALGESLDPDALPPWEPVTHPPEISRVAANGMEIEPPYVVALRELDSIHVEVEATDPDGDLLAYRAYVDGLEVSEPEQKGGARFSFDPQTRTFQWDVPPGAARPDPYKLMVVASDGLQTRTATVDLVVNAIHAPVVDRVLVDGLEQPRPYQATVEELASLTVQIEGSDPDGDPLAYQAWLEGGLALPPGSNEQARFSFDPVTRTFEWTPQFTTARPEPYELTFGIQDGVFTTLVTVEITVVPVHAPVVERVLSNGLEIFEPYEVFVPEGEPVQVQLQAFDPDGDPVTATAYFLGQTVPAPTEVPDPEATFTFDPADYTFRWVPRYGMATEDPYTLSVVFSDGTLQTLMTVNIFVHSNPVVAPEVSLAVNQEEFHPGSTLRVTLTLENDFSPATVDLYLAFGTPQNPLAKMIPATGPLAGGVTLPNGFFRSIPLISYTFPSLLKRGTTGSRTAPLFSIQLAFTAILVPQGGDVRNPSVWLSSDTVSFTYSIP